MATVDIHYARAILACYARSGLSIEQLLGEAGIDQDILANNDSRIAGEKITYLVKHTWARLDDEFMGCTEHPCKHGVFALMSKYSLNHDSLPCSSTRTRYSLLPPVYRRYTDAIKD